MNLDTAFAMSARKHGSKTALFSGESQYSYQHFSNQAAWVGRALSRDYGVRRGDRVGIWLKNCPEFISALFGTFQTGAVATPINNFLKPLEVGYILEDAGIDVLITEAGMGVMLDRLREARPSLRFFKVEDFAPGIPSGENEFTPVPSTEKDMAVIIYTSGTTGHPKGAVLSHGNLLHNVASCQHVLETVEYDRFGLMLPMFHSFMLTVCVLLPLLSGSSIVLIKSLHSPKSILQEIIQHQTTLLPAIPQLFRALAHFPVPPALPVRLCVSGAAPLPLETLRAFSERYPMPLIEGYGLSEASPVVSMNPIRGMRKAGSIGLPVKDVFVSIRRETGEEMAQGRTGEVCVRGGNVMIGYWNKPEETAMALRDGWLYTGDIGHMDEDGFFYITDRKKDMLLVNGINVYPREIEELIYQFPGVKEAAVIGRPDPRRGEQPVAYVSMDEGVVLDEHALIHFLKPKLADYKVPKRIVPISSLPRNASGKVLKTTLRGMPL